MTSSRRSTWNGRPSADPARHSRSYLAHLNQSSPRPPLEGIDRPAFASEGVGVSAFCFWEVAMLAAKRGIRLNQNASSWRWNVLKLGIVEIRMRGAIAIAVVELSNFHGDPADRAIVATAMLHGVMLFTADDRILRWKNPRRNDARE